MAQAQIVQEVLAQLTWYHQVALLEKLDGPEARVAYARAAIHHGWSRNVLVFQIESGYLQRVGAAQTNFALTLPEPDSDLAQQLVKDPYVFEFLDPDAERQERALERQLLDHLRDFLLELGTGFAFVGNQVHLDVGGEDFYLDLLFYHLRLRRYVVIELKVGRFRPEYAGKLNFYLNVVDDKFRDAELDGQTIGLLLCRGTNETTVEYALRGIQQPMGVSQWETSRELPAELNGALPTVAELEERIAATRDPNTASQPDRPDDDND